MNQELNILYIVLTVGFGLLVLFACFALYRLTVVLGELERTLERVNHITHSIDTAVSAVVPTVTTLSGVISGISGYISKLGTGHKPKSRSSK